ncbi:G-protein coupled receptor 26 isoform X5 [Globicephala melas]|nr:G-protein coupled receptor 26 isoform X5 [Globicephala melas]
MPLTLAGVVAQRQPAGDRLCRLAAFLDTFLAANSMLSMAALSIDRWVAVVFPLSYRAKMRLRDAALMVAYTWLHALAFPAAAVVLSWLGFHQLYASCTLCSRRPDERLRFAVFTGAFHALSFLLSFVVLCCTYFKVLKVARFHCRRIDVITMQTLVLLVDIHPSVRERCLEEQRRRRQRATKKISTFIGTFLVCFAPYVITRCSRTPLCWLEEEATSPSWGHENCQVRLGWMKFADSLTAPMARLTGLAVGGTSPSPPPSLYFSSLSTKLHLIVLAKSTLKATSLGSSSKSARLSPTGMQSPRSIKHILACAHRSPLHTAPAHTNQG